MTTTPYKKLTYDDTKVQVESAIRDGEGVKISTNYAKKTEIKDGTLTINTQGGTTLGTFTANQTTNQTVTLPNGSVQMQNVDVTFTTYTPTQAETDAGIPAEFPYRATVTVSGVTSSTFVEIAYNEDQATSLNYPSFCMTDENKIYIYSRTNVTPTANDTVTIPTISIGMDYSDIVIDTSLVSGSGNAISSGAVYTALVGKANDSDVVKLAGNQAIAGQKTFTDTPTIRKSFPQLYMESTSDDSTVTYTEVDTKFYFALHDKNGLETGHLSDYVYNGGRGFNISCVDKSSGSVKTSSLSLQTPKTGDPYVIASYRTTGLTNNDVLTAGNGVTLGTQQTITNTKYFRNTAVYSSGAQYAPVIAMCPDATSTSGFIGGERSSSTASALYFQVFRPSDGQSMGAMFVRTDGASAWVQAPNRTYSPSNSTDVMTVGMYDAITTGTGTVASGCSLIDGVAIKWYRKGHLCTVCFPIRVSSSYTGTYTQYLLATGLPASIISEYPYGCSAVTVDNQENNGGAMAFVNTVGHLYLLVRHQTMAGKGVVGSVTYITA